MSLSRFETYVQQVAHYRHETDPFRKSQARKLVRKTRKQLTRADYLEAKKYLSIVHKFSFRTPRKDYKSHQKAAITRAFEKYGHDVKWIREGYAELIKPPKGKKKKFKKFMREFGDKKITNKGAIYYKELPERSHRGKIIEETEEEQQESIIKKIKFRTGGIDAGLPDNYLVVEKRDVIEVLIPVPYLVGDEIIDFIEMAEQHFEPLQIMLQINGYHGKHPIDKKLIRSYMGRFLDNVDEHDGDAGEIITGVYLIFPNTKLYRKLWGL